MIRIITARDTAELARMDAFAAGHPNGHILQCPRWRNVKERWDWRGVLSLDGGGGIRGSLSILIRPLPFGAALLYAPRGPVCDWAEDAVLEELFRGARQVAREVGGCVLKLDPPAPEADAAFCARLERLGFHRGGNSLNFEGIQPRFVFRLPLSGRTGEELLAAMEGRTRYKIRLAARRGVRVRFWQGDGAVPEAALADFSRLMEETGRRDGFLVRKKDYFRGLLSALGENARLYLAYVQGEAVAGAVSACCGGKCWYLYGASGNVHREVMPNYLLQWSMIGWARAQGAAFYDFRGVSGDLTPEHPLYGLYRFKKGFGGELCAFAGEFTRVYRPVFAAGLALGMRGNALLRRLRRPKRGNEKQKRIPE